MVLGIDIDDTLTETKANSQKFLKEFNSQVDDYHKLDKELYEEFLNLYIEDIMRTNPLKPKAKESLDKLHNMGYKIIIITARSNKYNPNIKKATINYLKENKIYYDKIIFDDAQVNFKGAIASFEKVDLFIDDREDILDEIAGFGIKCLRFTTEKSKYKTFCDWKKLVEYIERL